MGRIIVYSVIGMLLTSWFLFTGTGGYSFSLKTNFLANFFAPLTALVISELLNINSFGEFTQYIFILIVSLIFVYSTATLTLYYSIREGTTKKCKKPQVSTSMKYALTNLVGALCTFIIVVSIPNLQEPFISLLSYRFTVDADKIVYGIIGFYMALVSFSTTSLTYFPAVESGCLMSEEEIKNAFRNGYKTMDHMENKHLDSSNLEVKHPNLQHSEFNVSDLIRQKEKCPTSTKKPIKKSEKKSK